MKRFASFLPTLVLAIALLGFGSGCADSLTGPTDDLQQPDEAVTVDQADRQTSAVPQPGDDLSSTQSPDIRDSEHITLLHAIIPDLTPKLGADGDYQSFAIDACHNRPSDDCDDDEADHNTTNED